MWAQLLLEFSTDHFEIMHTCLTWSVNVVLGLSSLYVLLTFSSFATLFFPGSITIRIDTLWAQFPLEFSTDHFETMHTCSTWSVNVHVVLGLSSRYF